MTFMGQRWPSVLITTSREPSEQARILIKACKHVIPNAIELPRGNLNQFQINDHAQQLDARYVIFVNSKGNKVDTLEIYRRTTDSLQKEPVKLKFYQYIDHMIFGFHQLPETGPLSTDLKARQEHPSLLDFFEAYFGLTYTKKQALWFTVDRIGTSERAYIAFIDALTQKKFFYAEVEILTIS